VEDNIYLSRSITRKRRLLDIRGTDNMENDPKSSLDDPTTIEQVLLFAARILIFVLYLIAKINLNEKADISVTEEEYRIGIDKDHNKL
jgi:hypothetical protein